MSKKKLLTSYGSIMKLKEAPLFIFSVDVDYKDGKVDVKSINFTKDRYKARKIKDETLLEELRRIGFEEVEILINKTKNEDEE